VAYGSNKILLKMFVCTISPVELIFARKFWREFFYCNFFFFAGPFLADHGKTAKIVKIRTCKNLLPQGMLFKRIKGLNIRGEVYVIYCLNKISLKLHCKKCMEVGQGNLHVDFRSHLLEVSVTVNVFPLM